VISHGMPTKDFALRDAEARTPVVSIVVPTYNRAHLLPRAIESLRGQTWTDFEIVIVNDGSKDGTKEVVEGLAALDFRVRGYEKPNGGIADTLNFGFARARGRYVTWNSDDNFYHPQALEKMVRYLDDHPDVDLVYTDARDVDAEGRELRIFVGGPPENLREFCTIRGCLLYRREVNQIVGPYDPRWPTVQDYNFYRRAFERVHIGYIPEVLYDYTVHEASMSGPHIDCVWEFGRHQDEFAHSPGERRHNWARCFAEIARTERAHGRAWNAAWFRLRAAVLEPARITELPDDLRQAAYQAAPRFVRTTWRSIKARLAPRLEGDHS
jgi:glycosyltransferase involved in cell wall biosynthesis